MKKILIVEDDVELAEAMAGFLQLKEVECDFAYHGESALELVKDNYFDAIILDLMLPKLDGVAVCERIRQAGVNTPVLMLTACDTNQDQLRGFQAGIDDYVVKPSSMPLIWARLQALLRRCQPESQQMTVDTLTCYFNEQRACREGKSLKLTPTGWKMLELLIKRSPAVVLRQEIEEYVWPGTEVETSNFNVQLHQLRKAVDKPFAYPLIHTVVGRGLCLRQHLDD